MKEINVMRLITPKVNVAYLEDTYTLKQGLEVLKDSGFTAIPVIRENGELEGVVTEGDFLWHIVRKGDEDLDKYLIKDLRRRMKYDSAKIDEEPEALLDKAMRQNFVPVIDSRNCFCGIVTRQNIIKHFVG